MLHFALFSLWLFSCFCAIPTSAQIQDITHQPSSQKRIVVIIASFNNADNYERNLTMLLAQQCEGFDFVALYFEDASTDNTFELVKAFLEKYDHKHRVHLIHNEANQGSLANTWRGIWWCNNNDIVVTYDGDDFFPHEHVLATINRVYSDPKVFATFGQYAEFPSCRLGHCREIPPTTIDANGWRDLPLPLPTSHLRTFYAGLAKQIALKDLLYQGTFLSTAADLAFFWPVLEMAGHHTKFISDVLYVYRETELNDYKLRFPLQLTLLNYMRKKEKYRPLSYERLQQLIINIPYQPQKADLVIFSYNRPLQLYALLESLDTYVTGLGSIIVVLRADESYAAAYEHVKERFPQVIFFEQSRTNPRADFKEKTIAAFEYGSSDYLMFAVDDNIVRDHIDLNYCIQALQQTHAYGFYLRLGRNITYCYTLHCPQKAQLIPIKHDIFAWQFKYGDGDWAYPNSLDMTIFKKTDIQHAIHTIDYHNPTILEAFWYIPEYVDITKIGLCYDTSKIVNIPLNVVQTDRSNAHMNISSNSLLKVFEQGLKIDIAPFHTLIHQAPHTECEISYLPR